MKSIICAFCLAILPICLGFIAESEYPYIFTIVFHRKFVDELTVCAAIELVEDQYYLLPKTCFNNLSSNKKIKAALLRKKRLKFKPLVYEPFVIRWETFSDFVILEKSDERDLEVAVASEVQYSMKHFVVTNMTNHSIVENVPNDTYTPEFEEKQLFREQTNSSERRKRYIKYKAHFKDRFKSSDRKKRFDSPLRLPPFIQDEEKLPPRVLLTIPKSPLFSDCFTLGWGTFFSKDKSLKGFEGLELRKAPVNSIKPGVIDPVTGFYFSEIWFEREKDQKYVEDLGSPMVCKVKDRGDIEVIIGLFMGGNNSLNHQFDSYRSFMGEFYYITHWAIGTNVSITGDPASWTLWPVEYNEQPKSKGIKIELQVNISSFIVFTFCHYYINMFPYL